MIRYRWSLMISSLLAFLEHFWAITALVKHLIDLIFTLKYKGLWLNRVSQLVRGLSLLNHKVLLKGPQVLRVTHTWVAVILGIYCFLSALLALILRNCCLTLEDHWLEHLLCLIVDYFGDWDFRIITNPFEHSKRRLYKAALLIKMCSPWIHKALLIHLKII